VVSFTKNDHARKKNDETKTSYLSLSLAYTESGYHELSDRVVQLACIQLEFIEDIILNR
jgi:hypothetical protein